MRGELGEQSLHAGVFFPVERMALVIEEEDEYRNGIDSNTEIATPTSHPTPTHIDHLETR